MMADSMDITANSNLLAIDVARRSNAVLIELANGSQRRFRMTNTAQDFDRLLKFISNTSGLWRAALEPTGDYHRAIANRLLNAGVDVVLISSVAQARYREAKFNSWDKNDPKDASVILDMLKHGMVMRYVDPLIHGHHDLQELSKTYYQVTRARTKILHAIVNHHLPLYFPEMQRYWQTTRIEWWLRFMLEFPTPFHVRRLGQDEFIRAAWDLVGRKVEKSAKLAEIWRMAEHSAALPHALDCLAVETFRVSLRQAQYLNTLRSDLEHRAEQVLAENADYAQLVSLPGIGPINALTVLAEVGDMRRFGHHRQFLKYCGFDLAKMQSGAHRGREQLSKRGNARLRLAFWMAGQVAIRMRENAFKDKYDRYIRSDPGNPDLRRKALTAVAAKMARVAYSIVKTGQPYQRFYEQSLPSESIPISRAVEAGPCH